MAQDAVAGGRGVVVVGWTPGAGRRASVDRGGLVPRRTRPARCARRRAAGPDRRAPIAARREPDPLSGQLTGRPRQGGREDDAEQGCGGPDEGLACHLTGNVAAAGLNTGKVGSVLARRAARSAAGTLAIDNVATAPPPARSEIVTSPPQARVSSRAIGKPSPSPGRTGPLRRARDETARTRARAPPRSPRVRGRGPRSARAHSRS